jgi:hypothetical protein
MNADANLAAALAYARRGWPVLPCHTPAAAGCSCGHADCGSAGKHPRIAGGLTNATTSADQLRRWWTRWPNANVAVRTGAASGLVVVDIDPDHGGTQSIRRLVDRHGPLPAGMRVRTGSGGWHLYFAHPGIPVANSAGAIAPGIDIRGDGGYIIAPPSRHQRGGIYRAVGEPTVAALPDWLLDRLTPRPASTPQVRRFASAAAARSWAEHARRDELDRVAHAAPGTRNRTLNAAAYRLGRLIDERRLPPAGVNDDLLAAALAAGLGEREARHTIRSAMTAARGRSRADRHAGAEPA